VDLTATIYAAVLEHAGHDVDAGEGDGRWAEEAEQWARACLAAAPRDPFEPMTRRAQTYRQSILDRLVRSFELLDVTARSIVGPSVELPARSLWSGEDRQRLVTLEAARLANEARAKASKEAAVVEVQRPKTVGELGLEVIAVRRDRLAKSPEPFDGAVRIGETRDELFFGFRRLLALDLPSYAGDGLRVLGSTDVLPFPVPVVPNITSQALHFVRFMRRQHGQGLELGAIARWSLDGIDRAKAIAAEYAPTLFVPRLAFMSSYVMELLVRGLTLEPRWAEQIVREATYAIEVARAPRVFKKTSKIGAPFGEAVESHEAPPPMSGVQAELAQLAMAAANGGSVSAGALISQGKKE
jgi:hypothetical protein